MAKTHNPLSANVPDSFTLRGISDANTWDHDTLISALLFDIRKELRVNTAELRRLNALLHCSNFVGIPRTLARIDKRLATKAPLRGKK